MKRLSQDEGRKASARIAEQAGFTLVELLVTMLIGIVVLGGGTYGLAEAFSQSTEITDRVENTSNAEVGLQRLTSDLRQAVPCPSYTDTSGASYYPQVSVSSGTVTLGWNTVSTGTVALYVTSNNNNSSYPVLAICDPVPGTHSTLPPQDELVVWNCELTSESCLRTWQTIPVSPTPGSHALGVSQGSVGIYGVSQLVLSGTTSSSSSPSALALNSTYALTTGITNGATTVPALSSVGISGKFFNLSDPSNPGSSANKDILAKTKSISITTGAALRNYGT